jgi:hypothetical protein
MADEKKTPSEVEITFERPPDYRLVPANGAWIGVTTRGELRIDFFVEDIKPPTSVTHQIGPDLSFKEEIVDRRSPAQITRELQVGIFLSLDAAQKIADVIQDRIRLFREMQEKLKGEKE